MSDKIDKMTPEINKITQEINTQPIHEKSPENLVDRKERIQQLATKQAQAELARNEARQKTKIELEQIDDKFKEMIGKMEIDNSPDKFEEIKSIEPAIRISVSELKDKFATPKKPREVPVTDK